jgi:hypothetical protein
VLSTEADWIMNTESLHVKIAAATGSGKYLAIAAWHQEESGRRSIPLALDTIPTLGFPVEIDPDPCLIQVEVGEIALQALTLVNTFSDSIFLRIADWSPRAEWLAVDTAEHQIESSASAKLLLAIDAAALSAGEYGVELTFACRASGALFRDGNYSILLTVDEQTSVVCDPGVGIGSVKLGQNHPNPFNSQTTILSTSEQPVEIYDITGNLVSRLAPVVLSSDRSSVFIWNATDRYGQNVASGLYFYRQAGQTDTRKMLLIK